MTSSPASTKSAATPEPPRFADIEAAAERLAGQAVLTPLLEFPVLNERLGARVLLKAETLQRTGSFKFRGAYNTISRLSEAARRAGIVAYSSGNHAQGVAAAAALVGAPATIVMPADAPAIKMQNTRDYGAEVVVYDRYGESREQVAEKLAAERRATLVRPYDDPDIIAGQGTCGLEIARQAEHQGGAVDLLLVCCGGGGLVSGIALAFGELSPATEIFAVEPAGFDDTARSLAAGERLGNDPEARSFCDALLAARPGAVTFEINRQRLAGGLVVSDAEVAQAMAFAFRVLKLVVEPGGAVALAALLSGKARARGKRVGVVLSGGNVDPETFCAAIGR